MKALYVMCTLFLGFLAYSGYTRFKEGTTDCIRPLQQAADAQRALSDLDISCKQIQADGEVAERFLNAVTR